MRVAPLMVIHATIGDDAARIAHAIRNSTPEQLDAMRVSLI